MESLTPFLSKNNTNSLVPGSQMRGFAAFSYLRMYLGSGLCVDRTSDSWMSTWALGNGVTIF